MRSLRKPTKFEFMSQWGITSQEQYDEAIDRRDWRLCPIKDDRDGTNAKTSLSVWRPAERFERNESVAS